MLSQIMEPAVPQRSADESSLARPPICTLRVGVTGHRTPPKLPGDKLPQIRSAVREVLTFVRSFTQNIVSSNQGYAKRVPELRIISSLAEGADRLVAEEGLNPDLGFKLQCPLPAHRDEYRRDFTEPSSKEEFDRLLGQANAVFEFNGQRAGTWLESGSYEAVGRVTLAQSDMLIAVWDGEEGKPGGTAQMVREAQQAGIPTIRIAPQNPTLIEFLSLAVGPVSEWREELGRALTTALSAPASTSDHIAEFLSEALDRTSERDPVAKQREQADQIAGLYAVRYRRAYKRVYWLAPTAVLFAIAGWWLVGNRSDTRLEWLSTCIELLCIGAILSVTWYGRRRRWHDRWLDARVLAEQFRTWEFLAPIGQTPPTSRLPPYMKAKHGDWTGWYFRARVREHGLTSAELTPEYLAEYQRQLLLVVTGQAQHHRDKGEARRRTYELIEFSSTALFGLTGLFCFVHLILPFVHLISPQLVQYENTVFLTTLAALTAVLPAFGAALEGLQAQGEYQRLSERSEGMCHYFTSLKERFPGAETQPLSYTALADLAHQASGVMLDELSDWRNLVRVRNLHPV